MTLQMLQTLQKTLLIFQEDLCVFYVFMFSLFSSV